MESLNRKIRATSRYPERVLQFGEGNFLRAFANWIIHKMNKEIGFDTGVVVVQPIRQGLVDILNTQDGLYTLYLNGIKNGEAVSEYEIIDCIQRGINPYEDHDAYLKNAENPELKFIISNTTEAGIVYDANDQKEDKPQKSFPGKLTALLYKRFETFGGAPDKGLIIIPCELIDRNGDHLKKIVLRYATDWNLGDEFIRWINENHVFCNTLVDRIVPGYPKARIAAITEELGYQDHLVVEGEQFHLWVIEGPPALKEAFPAATCGLNVIFTDNMEPYRTRKVRILNGAHTALVPVGYLCGLDTVGESLEDDTVGSFLKDLIFNEICPTLDLPETELHQFANAVLDRFRNPYLAHALMSISLNSIAKFKTRVLPSIIAYIKIKNKLPEKLLFSLAALIVFYKGDRNGATIAINDSPEVLDFFRHQWTTTKNTPEGIAAISNAVLSNTNFWGMDLTQFEGLKETITDNLNTIINKGIKKTITR